MSFSDKYVSVADDWRRRCHWCSTYICIFSFCSPKPLCQFQENLAQSITLEEYWIQNSIHIKESHPIKRRDNFEVLILFLKNLLTRNAETCVKASLGSVYLSWFKLSSILGARTEPQFGRRRDRFFRKEFNA